MEHAYLVCYDIRDPRRWRRVYRTMKGCGEWLQLSVFHCRLTREKRLRMQASLSEMINRNEDHLLIIDLGPAEALELRVESIGKPFDPIERNPVIV
jgi:CRISPR-associated protein Cas2